jgi:hypothetical protein
MYLACHSGVMRRAAIALGLMIGTLVPALVASVWLFGCCVLPFHQTLHRIVPLCRIATSSHSSDQRPSTPAQEKQRPAPRLMTELTAAFCVSVVHESSPLVSSSPAARRSLMTLGAIRCDRDVGLHTLFATFLI